MGGVVSAVSNLVGSIFGGGRQPQPQPQIIVAPPPAPVQQAAVPAAPAATPAPAPAPTPMATPETPAAAMKKKAMLARNVQRGGRQSTILTAGDSDTLGG